ncbi:hypothetical protein EN974_15950 [Mesorhizobium sp. M7A.F.Ca.CA.001.12.2.1]|uniref:hypothetical protein n=1 Tax=Mesorhizobium sp. M7A.F.Ca.CA.001.12.2.1 TaxID=2496725 RepID=UPI000FCAF7FB|nr:hypothetical protein [Mesorhizobium sp. M7A.F.Ca.CA.001.12.2.1]RUY98219.1 hypothetical protein EN974_15950 [Mesorhizobium sp. M7A.F.Ca.CA.001.12.2.1]
MIDKKSETEAEKEICEVVGRIVLMASLLDNQLNAVLVAALSLGGKALTLAVVAALDPARKVEILKAFVTPISNDEWKKPVLRYADGVEKVNRARNLAAHSMVIDSGGEHVLATNSVAKLLKATDRKSRAIKRVPLNTLSNASDLALKVYKEGESVIANFGRVELERNRRGAAAQR